MRPNSIRAANASELREGFATASKSRTASWPVGLEPARLPGKRYAVLQESSAPRGDEHAIWDTLRSRKPGSLRAMPSQFETSCAI